MAYKRPHSPVSPPPLKRKVVSSASSAIVSSFFTPVSEREPEQLAWKIVNESLIVGKYAGNRAASQLQTSGSEHEKFAIFDLDGTLISGNTINKWGRSPSSWKWLHEAVPEKLRDLNTKDYKIVIFSNQGNVSLKENSKVLQKDSLSLANFKGQLLALLRSLDLPVSVYAATGDDRYRKPRTGMWMELLEDYHLDNTKPIDLESSFFVGDAAGRPKSSTRPKDHACSDRNLAANIGIKFYTPEEYFSGVDSEEFERDFEPSKYLSNPPEGHVLQAGLTAYSRRNPVDIVLFCGSPGAGKSTFFWKWLQPLGYERVNQDILKTRDKCLKVARAHLSDGRSVAIDNTNANVESRSYWVDLGKALNIPIRCVHFTASTKLCEHNDTVRALNPSLMNPERRSKLPPVAFRSFVSRYSIPRVTEGLQDIVDIDFKFHGRPEQRDVWKQYWVSKFST